MSEDGEFNPFPSPLNTVTDHGDEWVCELQDGRTMCVPKDPKNRHARTVQRHIDAGSPPINGEASQRRRIRNRLRDEPIWKALTKYLAGELGHTVQEVRQGILDEL